MKKEIVKCRLTSRWSGHLRAARSGAAQRRVRAQIVTAVQSPSPYKAPLDVLSSATTAMETISNERLFNDPQYQKLHESWVAAKFGVGYTELIGPCEIAVNDSVHRLDADFFLREGNQEFAFQIAEVQTPGRRRGEEQRRMLDGRITSLPYEPGRGAIEGPDWIRLAIERKGAKNYAGSERLNLVIYANFSAEGLDHSKVKQAANQFSGTFMSIWVLSNYFLGTLFPAKGLGVIDGWGIMGNPFEP